MSIKDENVKALVDGKWVTSKPLSFDEPLRWRLSRLADAFAAVVHGNIRAAAGWLASLWS